MPIILLHLHSHWSLLDGVPSVGELVGFAKTHNLSALALTYTNALYGAVEFATECRDADTRPIIGAELTITGGHFIILLAQSREGYANLCRLCHTPSGSARFAGCVRHPLPSARLAASMPSRS